MARLYLPTKVVSILSCYAEPDWTDSHAHREFVSVSCSVGPRAQTSLCALVTVLVVATMKGDMDPRTNFHRRLSCASEARQSAGKRSAVWWFLTRGVGPQTRTCAHIRGNCGENVLAGHLLLKPTTQSAVG